MDVQIVNTVSDTSAFSEREAMSLLNRFNFNSKRWYDRVGQLSGGERRRLQLLQVLAAKPNVLLLDEPSNDLDLSTLTSLEEYLTEVFDGCLLVVSHDHFFVNRVAEHLFVFQGDGIVRDFQGSYTEYLDFRKDVQAEELAANKAKANHNKSASNNNNKQSSSVTTAAVSSPKDTASVPVTTTTAIKAKSTAATSTTTTSATKKELSYTERKEFNKLEKEIEKLNKQIAELELQLTKSSEAKEGFTVLGEYSKKINTLKAQLLVKEEAWLLLAE